MGGPEELVSSNNKGSPEGGAARARGFAAWEQRNEVMLKMYKLMRNILLILIMTLLHKVKFLSEENHILRFPQAQREQCDVSHSPQQHKHGS